jgi:hypothetical protein
LGSIKNELTETLASRDAAQASSLITRLDSPVLGEKPVGPGRTTIVGGATVGGLMFGLGIVFLLAPMDVRVAGGRRSENEFAEDRDNYASASQTSNPSTNSQLQNSQHSSSSTGRGSGVSPSSTLTTAPRDNASALKQREPMVATVESPLGNNDAGNSTESTLAKVASSATAAARDLDLRTTDSQPVKPRRAESLDDVRNLIAAALKTHAEGGE